MSAGPKNPEKGYVHVPITNGASRIVLPVFPAPVLTWTFGDGTRLIAEERGCAGMWRRRLPPFMGYGSEESYNHLRVGFVPGRRSGLR